MHTRGAVVINFTVPGIILPNEEKLTGDIQRKALIT